MHETKSLTETRTETIELKLTGDDILALLRKARKRLFRGEPRADVSVTLEDYDSVSVTDRTPVVVLLTRTITKEK